MTPGTKRRTLQDIQRDLERLRRDVPPEHYAREAARFIHEINRAQRHRYARR